MSMKSSFLPVTGLLAVMLAGPVHADPAAEAGKVVVSGAVPDEASRTAIIEKLRSLYGAASVVDKLEVGGVTPPPRWSENMGKILNADLKQISQGELRISGTQIALRGNVGSEASRQKLASSMAALLNPTYLIDNGLVVAGGQGVLDTALANRVVEFESGSANLTATGQTVLDEMAEAIRQIGTPKVQLIGHTDSLGEHELNVTLSRERANSAKDYLAGKGIPPETLTATGVGPDQPIASNGSAAGRARNRRIEFKLVP